MTSHPSQLLALILMIVAGMFVIGNAIYYMRFSGIRKEKALPLWAVTTVLLGGWIIYRHESVRPRFRFGDEESVATLAAALCILVAIPFVLRMWSKWVGGDLTEAERAPGPTGWRAWLRGGHMVPALLIAVLGWYGFGIALPLMLLLTVGALAIYPAVMSITAASPESVGATAAQENIAPERAKVLAMLESGKITAEESAELLNALGATMRRAEPAAVPITGSQRLVFIGAAVLFLGFLLPWLQFDPGAKVGRAMSKVMGRVSAQVGMPDMMGQMSLLSSGMEIKISGASIAGGLGWAALLLGITAAVLPFAARSLDHRSLRMLRFLALGSGAAIILYVLSDDPRSVGVGLVVAAIGYILEFIGVAQDRRAA